MINRVVLVGRMTRDPELRTVGNNASVTSFTLAMNRNYNSTNGQQADFINCTVWNKVAENVKKYCSKGSLVGVEGRLQSRSYDNAQGQKVYVVEVVCDSVQFLETKGAREANQQQGGYQQGYQQPQGGYQQQPQNNNNYYDAPPVAQAQPVQPTRNLQEEFGNSDNSYAIMEDDLPF
ncbi:single-stranded DNA-binding protein [Tannockella kyphosi]|uniref:single-stranded DNA-binding protein n=1 Tax=Tannockella kyphosi TaxID=2899121 RepID=UPI002012B68F|nr:single-stranded DNA-binding protein [Tannockella kyphosi]